MAKADHYAIGKKHKITEEKTEELKEAFEVFDKDGDGEITVAELHQILNNLGQKTSLADVKKMIAEVDKDNNEKIDFEEFVIMMLKKQEGKDELFEAFKAFDKNGDGQISHAELKEVMKSMGQDMSDAEIDQMIIAADTDKDGEISFVEFKKMMGSS